MLSKQNVFDTVVAHARKQGEQAINDFNASCYYRKPGSDLKCFIGALIPDNLYDSRMDEMTPDGMPSKTQDSNDASQLFENYPDVMKEIGLSDDMVPFLMNLQGIHDNFPAKDWDAKLFDLATDYNLTMTK